jgi:hypothetical protein
MISFLMLIEIMVFGQATSLPEFLSKAMYEIWVAIYKLQGLILAF